MCGILGEFVYNNHSLIDRSRFLSLLELSRNRGPDSQGYFTNDNNFQFGFNRLSILDLSENGNQPIHSSTGRYTMVFNGEIYNHLELRKLLPSEKYLFQGNGDAESLIACFDYFGIIQTVDKLNGMFAIGIFDHFNNKLFLIRDFAGIKPLHYGWNGKLLVFASQYNQISRHPAFSNEPINEEILKLYLNQHFIPSPFGLLYNTFSVQPGEIVTFDGDIRKESQIYWNFPEYNHHKEENVEELEQQIKDDLDSAVKEELLSDVPLGAFLSGGVDSPLICYFAKNNLDEKFNTFSMGSDSADHDESIQAMKYANSLQSSHYSTHINAKNSLDALEKAVVSAGEPFGDFSIIPTWQLSKLAKGKVTVALSGDGGDELFFGYERFRSIGKNHRFWHYPYWLRYYLRGLDKLIYNERHINECILAPSPGEAHRGLHSRFPSNILHQIAPDLKEVEMPHQFNLYDYSIPNSQNELIYNIRKAEFYGMLQKTLTKVDRASMAHGLEVRVPFLNKSFLEKILLIDISIHKPLQNRKKILFQILNKCYPKVKPVKTKMGFSISLSNWIKQDYQQPFRDKLLDKSFCDSFGFDKSAIESMLSDHITDQKDYKWPLFSLYSLSIWNERGRKLV